MPRSPRNYLNTSFFHVMSQGINKEFIFNNAVDIKFYIKNMYEIKDKYHIEIIAYCIMNNHTHLLIKTNIIKNLSSKITVFITTHNNTLGMLMQPDRIIYTYHENDRYDLFSGEFGSKVLKNSKNNELIAYNHIISVMEAGQEAYERRRCIYENIKN